MNTKRTLLLIAAFLALMLGSFIWYVATWDNRKASAQAPIFILAQELPPEAPALAKGTTL